jgi:peptide-methionine (S)-S-oxide reductase
VTTQSEEIFLAGGCLWGVQEFVRYLPGVTSTEAGRANGTSNSTEGEYDGYAECVRTSFDLELISLSQLIEYFFEIIDPYSLNRQGPDIGKKYRTGVYSRDQTHLGFARSYIKKRNDSTRIAVEVLPLTNYVKSDEEHQDRLTLNPSECCHIAPELLHKYKKPSK